jgi:integrase
LLDELTDTSARYGAVLVATGLRQSNVLKLEWSQVNLELCHAWVPGTQSKNRRPIAVPLNDMALDCAHVGRSGKHPERVFTYRGNRSIAVANTKVLACGCFERAGIEDFRWHDFGIPGRPGSDKPERLLMSLQRLGGWRTGAMVERYAHLAPDQSGNCGFARLDSVLSGYDSATRA